MARILHYGSRLAALGTAAGAGWWFGSNSRETGGLPEGLFNKVFGKVSAAALQGYNMQAPAELPPLEPAAPRVTQIMQYGFPSLTNVRARADYVISYDTRTRVPYWVCEHLTADRVAKNPDVDRAKCDFHEDASIHEYFRSENKDYKFSGFDRGHMAAAGNHKLSQFDCHQTFLLSNMAPQVGRGFNRDKWNELESYCRKLTRSFANVYVCTGPLYLPRQEEDGKLYVKYQVLGQNHVAVPTHFFKVVVCENPSGDFEMESFLLPNAVIEDSTPLSTFLNCLLIQLLDWFKSSFFSWFDCPSCPLCHNNMAMVGSLPPTEDDLVWGGSRVEGYACKSCNTSERFVRYNHPGKLLETRRGRCGEWANCFTLLCRTMWMDASLPTPTSPSPSVRWWTM